MEQLLTRWGRKLDTGCPLNDYPRPQMRRHSFINLNGRWDYAIYPTGAPFAGYTGEIIVPFSPETLLSGVQKTVTPADTLYYRRRFTFARTGARVLLHFGAVDYACRVKLNGVALGEHRGGYDPFTFEATAAVISGENELTVEVTDPAETGAQASGKQTSHRGQIWYTPQSGIWQTVWLEEVPETYIESLRITPDIDAGTLTVNVRVNGAAGEAHVTALDGAAVLAEGDTAAGTAVLRLSSFELWSPDSPRLYDLTVSLGEDTVQSYFGMRKFGVGKDANGVPRLMLNNEPYFMNGLLDQGYWSDGMYTAPSDEALIYDIQTMKDMGFNMLRKHIKIEPLRWYYHCDRLGMLVWQDLPSGGSRYDPLVISAPLFTGIHLKDSHYAWFGRKDARSRTQYEADLLDTVKHLYNCPCIALWVPFNEGWGQFDALRITDLIRKADPTRLVDHASGWHDQGGGDLRSYHIYFKPLRMKHDGVRALALTEFGGYSLPIEGHIHGKKFGYRLYKTTAEWQKDYVNLYEQQLLPLIEREGLSAAVYTELSDVEDELNGLLTFDRRVCKADERVFRALNAKVKL